MSVMSVIRLRISSIAEQNVSLAMKSFRVSFSRTCMYSLCRTDDRHM